MLGRGLDSREVRVCVCVRYTVDFNRFNSRMQERVFDWFER